MLVYSRRKTCNAASALHSSLVESEVVARSIFCGLPDVHVCHRHSGCFLIFLSSNSQGCCDEAHGDREYRVEVLVDEPRLTDDGHCRNDVQ